jgi:opacity protein-like surface antigen
LILFGYKPISKDDLNQAARDAGTTQAQLDTPAGQDGLNTGLNGIGTGFAYGLAVTYDFKSPDGQISGYVGPRMLIGSASGSTTTNGVVTNFSTNETSIGLTAGADYAITPDFTAGLSATYNFARNATVAATTQGLKGTAGFSASTFNFGLNVGYNF